MSNFEDNSFQPGTSNMEVTSGEETPTLPSEEINAMIDCCSVPDKGLFPALDAIHAEASLNARQPRLPPGRVDAPMDYSDNVLEGTEDSTFPYVSMSVEEVSQVTSLRYWTNTKVRVVGKFFLTDFSDYALCGVGQDKSKICLSLENLDQYPRHGSIVEIFGRLYADKHASHRNSQGNAVNPILLRVVFYTQVLDIGSYTEALSMMKPYIPLFVKR